MKHPKVPSVDADEDAATIFRAAKKNIQPDNRISFNKNNLKFKYCYLATQLPAISANFDSALMAWTQNVTPSKITLSWAVKCFHCLHAFQTAAAMEVVIVGFMLLGYIVESSKDYKSKIND